MPSPVALKTVLVVPIAHLSIASESLLRGQLQDRYPAAIGAAGGVTIRMQEAADLDVELPRDLAPVLDTALEQGADWVCFDDSTLSYDPDLPVLRLALEG